MRLRSFSSALAALAALAAFAACSGSAARPATAPPPQPAHSPPPAAAPASPAPPDGSGVGGAGGARRRAPILPPSRALLAGLMPLNSGGVDEFRGKHPTNDGRGVLIGILDSGVDPGVDGLITTSTGAPKLLDLRDFSGEGRVPLTPVVPNTDGTLAVAGKVLRGAGRVARLTGSRVWYAGQLSELPLGNVPAADLNGDGNNTDRFPVVVVKATDGWVAFVDSNLNGSFEDETPLHDYREGRETIALGTKPITLAANFEETDGAPTLDFVFDNSSHGTHVAGIAAGHGLFEVAGFDGVAPGAHLLGLKIANGARGGITMTGSIQRAMEYAARFAERRNLPLVLNLSFGVGNAPDERAVIDSIVDAFLVAHPTVVFTISAGNDGPALSTVGLPGSADLALSVGAALPGIYVPLVAEGAGPAADDFVESFSARGGERAKPDLVAPGWAFSSVPRWDTGNEIKAGTSMASPYMAGLAACLVSAMKQQGRSASGPDVAAALRNAGTGFPGASVLDQGVGLPRLERAYRWLLAGHQGSQYVVRAGGGASAAFRRRGLAGPGDTIEVFRVRHVAGLRAAQFQLRSDGPWLSAPATLPAGSRETEIPVAYSSSRLATPGVYVGTVSAWNPADTLAGPLFRLVNTVVVPYDLGAKPLTDERRPVGPAEVRRYFLRVPQAGATLEASVVIPDSAAQTAKVSLHEPDGLPFRDVAPDSVVRIGRTQPGTARFVVRAEDVVPGVYELDVVAPPVSGQSVTITVRAELAPLVLEDAEMLNPGQTTVGGRVAAALLGAERTFEVAGRGAQAESLTIRVPDWAAASVVEVQLPPDEWREFTDFGVTEFASSGQQIGQAPLEYAFGRHRFVVPPTLRGEPLTVELYPGFARDNGAHPWRATVRVRFLLPGPRAVGDEHEITVAAGGRAVLTHPRRSELALPQLPPVPSLPEGFAPLIELRLHPAAGQGVDAVRRVVVRE